MKPSGDVLLGLLDAAPDALLAVEPGGGIVFVNDQVETLFGWAKEALIGQPVECLVPGAFVAGHPALRAGYAAHPTTRPMAAGLELRARRRDGSEFPAEISLSSFKTAGGLLIAAAIRDVTTFRRTQQVLAAGPDAIVGVDSAGRIALVNEQVERLFGWTSERLLGQRVEVLVPVDLLSGVVAHRARYPQSSRKAADLQLTARRTDGSTFPADISLSTVTDEFGAAIVLAAVRDVSDRIELADERQRVALDAQREQAHRLESLGQLAGGVAHDFNNLLGVILNYHSLIARRVTDPIALADLDEIRAAAERGAALTRQLLMFARQDIAHPQPLDVVGVIRGAASMLERTLGEDIALRLELAEDRMIAIADPYLLEQIVFNLAINARDAMPAGGELTIAVERAPEPSADMLRTTLADVIVRVSDNGDGMTAEVAARAFEPFFTTKPPGEGTGLGLATVYGIVSQSGGTVALDSSAGIGTVVTVRLCGAELDVDPTGEEAAAISLGHERILFVEDETALRVGTARLLVDNGYVVVTAPDGVDALALFDRSDVPFDVVVTDIVMPRMRGDQLARHLAERGADLPVVFMSGFGSGGSLPGVMLPKPVDIEELLRAVREAIDG